METTRRKYTRSRSRSRSRSPSRRRYRNRSPSRNRSSSRGRRQDYRRDYSRSPRRNHRHHGRDDRENPNPSKCLGIFGLSYSTTDDDLKELLGKYGELEKVNIVFDRRSNQSRGFGFAYFENVEAASRAREATNGMELHGRKLRVDFSLTSKPHESTPGYYAGRRRSPVGSRDHHRSSERSRSRNRGRFSNRSPSYDRRRRSPRRSRSR